MLLDSSFFLRKTKIVARDLLGKIICFKNSQNEILKGRIAEVEAYLGIGDPACHTFQGRKTPKTKSMYLPGGHSYIYMIYGLHHCLNVVTGDETQPEAVLIRALEPLNLPLPNTNGPGRLCKSLGLTKAQDGLCLYRKSSGLWIEDDGFKVKKSSIAKDSRIGIPYAQEAIHWPLRFFLKDSPHISQKKRTIA